MNRIVIGLLALALGLGIAIPWAWAQSQRTANVEVRVWERGGGARDQHPRRGRQLGRFWHADAGPR